MARTSTYEEQEIQEAIRLVESAKTLQQLRQGQAILIPALTGASMEATARILGLGRNQVCVMRRKFREHGGTTYSDKDRRGGRHRELLSPDEEKAFLAPGSNRQRTAGSSSSLPFMRPTRNGWERRSRPRPSTECWLGMDGAR